MILQSPILFWWAPDKNIYFEELALELRRLYVLPACLCTLWPPASPAVGWSQGSLLPVHQHWSAGIGSASYWLPISSSHHGLTKKEQNMVLCMHLLPVWYFLSFFSTASHKLGFYNLYSSKRKGSSNACIPPFVFLSIKTWKVTKSFNWDNLGYNYHFPKMHQTTSNF